MKRLAILAALLCLSLTLTAAVPPRVTYRNLGVSKEDRAAVMMFEDADGNDIIIHISQEDARRLHDDLHAFYVKGGK